MALTIRHNILNALVAKIKTMAGPYTFLTENVFLGSLPPSAGRSRYSAGIVPGRETKTASQYPIEHCTLAIAVEFRMTINQGDGTPGDEAERILGELQKRIFEDTTLGGLCIDIRHVGNEIDIDSYSDKFILGVIQVQVNYRHNHHDPYNL